MQPIKLEDFAAYRFLSNPRISPDQQNAVFTVHQINLEENGYDSALWIYHNADQTTRQLTAGKDESMAVWLDATNLLFPSKRGQKEEKQPSLPATDFYQINLHGGEAKKLFTLPFPVLQIAPLGEGRYVVCGTFNGFAPDLTALDETEKQTALEAFREEQDYMIMDELPFWKNGQGYTNKKRNRLYLYDSRSNHLQPLTDPLYQVDEWHLAEDKTRILLVGSQFKEIEILMAELALIDLTQPSMEKTTLLAEGKYGFEDVAFTKTGYFFTANTQERYGLNENVAFYCMDAQTKAITTVSTPDFSMGNSVGSDNRYGGGQSFVMHGEEAAFLVTDRTCSRLCAMTVENGKTRMLSQASGAVDCFDWKESLCLFVGMRENQLQELYRLDPQTGKELPLTHFNEEVLRDKLVITPTPIDFINKDGVEIDGWVLEPAEYDDSKSYPAILDIHGGPKTAYGTLFFHEMQVWANMGYFVMFCNPRGSSGRGDQFADIRGRYGKEDYDDIMEFVDQVLQVYPQIKQEQLGVTGGSYGGFMTNWIVGQTDRFAGAAAQRSISNWVSMAGAADIGPFFDKDQVKGDAWNNLDLVWEQSPLKYANRCKTPTLFIHSDEDYRCWQAEAIQMFSALKLVGVPSRICMFKGENHELSRSGKPKHRIRRLQEITNWFETWVKK